MAGKPQRGFPWFKFYVATFDDVLITKLGIQFGPLGFEVYARIMSAISKNGYYIKANLEGLSEKLCKDIGSRWCQPKKVLTIILYCAQIGIFNSDLIDDMVITSKAIQEDYVVAAKRRKTQLEEYSLLSTDEIKTILSREDERESDVSLQKNNNVATNNAIVVAEMPIYATTNAREKNQNKNLRPIVIQERIPVNDQAASQTASLSNSNNKTLEDFKKAFPKIDTATALTIPSYVDWSKLIDAVKESPQWLQGWPLKKTLKHYQKAISGEYRLLGSSFYKNEPKKPDKIKGREYTPEELNGLYDNLEDIEI